MTADILPYTDRQTDRQRDTNTQKRYKEREREKEKEKGRGPEADLSVMPADKLLKFLEEGSRIIQKEKLNCKPVG